MKCSRLEFCSDIPTGWGRVLCQWGALLQRAQDTVKQAEIFQGTEEIWDLSSHYNTRVWASTVHELPWNCNPHFAYGSEDKELTGPDFSFALSCSEPPLLAKGWDGIFHLLSAILTWLLHSQEQSPLLSPLTPRAALCWQALYERFTGYPKATSVMGHLYTITGSGRNISHNSSLVCNTETVNDSWLQPREAGFG